MGKFKMASIFDATGATSPWPTMWSKNIRALQNSLLEMLKVRRASCSLWKYSRQLHMFFPACTIQDYRSSIYASHATIQSWDHLVHHSLKIAGAFFMPNGMTRHWSNPSEVRNANNSWARLDNGTCQYPFNRSNLLTYFSWPILSIINTVIHLGNGVGVSSSQAINLPEVCAKPIRAICFQH